MRIKHTTFTLCTILLLSAAATHGQDTIARFKYADAEKAFTNKNYTQAVTLLNETEALLGKPAPNVTHLRILAMNEQIKIDYPETPEELQKFRDDIDFYLTNFDIEGLEEKYRQVYDIQNYIKNIPKLNAATPAEFYFNKGLSKALKLQNEGEQIGWYQKAADLGHTGAQMLLAEAYKTGKLVTKDDKKAFEWQKKAAEGGNYKGQYDLAVSYLTGAGTAQNFEEAHKWYLKTVETTTNKKDAFGTPFYLMVSQYQLGRLYDYGQGVTQDYAKAIVWYQKAAEQGYGNAQNALGRLYQLGKGISKDPVKAFEWYKKAAEAGNVYAQTKVASLYNTGTGVAQNKTEATNWYQKAADGDSWPNINAKRAWARALYTGEGGEKNYAEALRLYLEVYAKSEDHELRMAIGQIHAKGGYGIQKDNEEALKWFGQVAAPYSDGNRSILNTEAAFQIAMIYEDQQQYEEAITWYKKTDGSYTYARFKIGLIYYEGKMGKPDFEQAREWIEKSGWDVADVAMAVMYFHGSDVKKDKDKSVELWKSSASSKLPDYMSTAQFYKMIQENGEYGINYPDFAKDSRDFFAFLEKDHPDLIK